MRIAPPDTIRSFGRLAVAAAVALTSIAVGLDPDSAAATGETAQQTPDEPTSSIAFDASTSPTTLFGRDATVAMSAENASSTDEFNLTFSAVLPDAVDYVPGSTRVAGEASDDPMVHRRDETTVLVWTNRSDLLVGATATLAFGIRPDTTVHEVGDTISVLMAAATHADARTVPDVDPETGAIVARRDEPGLATATTRLSPFDLTVSEPSAERELLRGVHDHRTVFTAQVENNLVRPTTGFALTAHLPAGLEFLGCGDVDNSALGTEEYPGAGRLGAAPAPAMANPCVAPSAVSTTTVDPDGAGPLPVGVYTRLDWDQSALAATFGTADLAPGASLALDFVAAIPLRSNVEADLVEPTANLDNNTGPLTSDEQVMTVHGIATGAYAGLVPSADEATEVTVAEDVSVHAGVSTGEIAQGATSSWTLLVESSEYALGTGPIAVADVVPDGLDVVATDPSFEAGYPVPQADGTTIVAWTLPGFTGPNGRRHDRLRHRDPDSTTGRPGAR